MKNQITDRERRALKTVFEMLYRLENAEDYSTATNNTACEAEDALEALLYCTEIDEREARYNEYDREHEDEYDAE